jgi:hypothetical protein
MSAIPGYSLALIGAALAIPLVVWGVRAHRENQRARKAELERLGFRPCPDRKSWLEAALASIENNQEYRYEVREPRKLAGDSAVYYYTKVRDERHPRDHAFVEEEVLFTLKRLSRDGVVLVVKPSSLKHGFATRALSAVAAGPWDTQPDDLARLEIPADLQGGNLVAAMGPPGARLYDLVDAGTLAVFLNAAGAAVISVCCRDEWCTITHVGAGSFPVGDLLSRIRPLLG